MSLCPGSPIPDQAALPGSREEIVTRSKTEVVPVPIETLVAVCADSERKVEWQGSCVESRMLDKQGETAMPGVPAEAHEYQRYALPFPLSNRDYVMNYKWTLSNWDGGDDGAKRTATQVVMSVALEGDNVPKPSPDIVRATIKELKIVLEEVDESSTSVTASINVDPAGSFPLWVVNAYCKTWSPKTISTMKMQGQKLLKEQAAANKAPAAAAAAQEAAPATEPPAEEAPAEAPAADDAAAPKPTE